MVQNDRLNSQEELLIRLVRHGATMYGYFIRERRGILSDAIARRYGVPAVIENMPEWMVEHGYVDPESVEAWLGLFASIERGKRSGAARVTLKSENNSFGRYWLRFNGITNDQGAPIFAIISFEDITQEHEQTRLQEHDINALLQATRKTFPEILTLNLSQGTYRMIQYDEAATLGTPREGRIDDMINIRLGGVVEEDRAGFAGAFSREKLEEAFLRDKKELVRLAYRRPGRDGRVHWFESTIMRQQNPFDSDVLLVAMSRHVDAQKAEEIRLREELRLRAEELRVTAGKLNRTICYYDVPTMTLTVPREYAREHHVPEHTPNYPACMDLTAREYFPETPEALRRFYSAMRRGEPTGSCKVAFKIPGSEETAWKKMEYAMVFDQEGTPRRAVIFVDDITVQRLQAKENQRLKENERILRLIAQHSDRIICHYDVQTEMARVWDPEACKKCPLPRLCEMPAQAVLESGDILPESVEELRGVFRDIRAGKPNGAIKMRARTKSGERRWFDLQYSTVYDDEGDPVSALISHKDITEQYEHELAYRRHLQSMESDKAGQLLFIESDLTANLVERVEGRMLLTEEFKAGSAHSDVGRLIQAQKFLKEGREIFAQQYARENLLELYAKGERQLKSEWWVRFRDGTMRWLDTDVVLMSDPYTGHVKAFFRLMDITEEKEERLAVQHRSERDGMTGLLNRATAEERIREKITAGGHPGILLLLDLDDLKVINDTFGHKEGDRAILGIAETLKTHFRDSDVIGRIGGDEFIVYLPGAAENSDAIAASVAALLRKLAGIPIGGNDERRIHCSVGCTVQTQKADSFEALYKRADTALYHVKRSGKNNFAFYAPEMDQADYQFQAQELLSLQNAKKFELAELQHLLSAVGAFCPLVLSMNLSTNDYCLMGEIIGGVFSKLPRFGVMDDFVKLAASLVHPGDAPGFLERLSRKALLQAYAQGARNVRHYFRFRGGEEYLWVETAVIFYTNEKGDVCDFTMVRWANERAGELEKLWLHKVLELAVVSHFEYICLVNVDSGEYFLYGDGKNTHAVPSKGSFDEITRRIRDRFILPEEQDAYYENARLANVDARMREGDGTYAYQYTMPDGPREASFHWFEPTHTQLLMTVRRPR